MDINPAVEEKNTHCTCEHCCRRSLDDSRDKADARAALTDDKASDKTPLSKEISAFEDKTAVQVVRKGEQFEYKISFQGKDKVLATTDATAKGLEEATKKIAELVDAKQRELEKTFNVAFSKQGDDVVKQWVEKADCSWERGDMVKARSPNMIELYGIQAALYRCQPSDITANGDGVKFHFLESNYYKDQPVLAYFVAGDKDGRPSVYFEPGANKSKPSTELDSDRFGKDHLMSVEALTTHELSHNHQAKTGWNSSPAEVERISKSIGWMPIVDAKTGSTSFMMRGKNDGEFYRYGKDNCKDSQVWVKADKDGNPLNEKGEKASFKEAKHYKRTDIADLALVKPLTYYFPSPKEMFAEGLMLFRLGNKSREQLLKESPAQYRAAKAQDQVEIDQRYGKSDSGDSKYVRSIEGTLKENSETQRKAIKDFEDKIQNKDKKAAVEGSKEAKTNALFVPKPILPLTPAGFRI